MIIFVVYNYICGVRERMNGIYYTALMEVRGEPFGVGVSFLPFLFSWFLGIELRFVKLVHPEP